MPFVFMRLLLELAIIFTMLGYSAFSKADLIDRGGGLIYDTDLNVTWLADANYASKDLTDSRVNQIIAAVGMVDGHTLVATDFLKDEISGNYTGQMSWWGAKAWANQLAYYNSAYGIIYTDFRLPTTIQNDTSCTNLLGAPRSDSLGFNCVGSEIGHLFYTELGGVASLTTSSLIVGSDPDLAKFLDIRFNFYHSDNDVVTCPNLPTADCGLYFSAYSGFQWATLKQNFSYSWPVLDGDIASRDTDGDGLVDSLEVSIGTNPNLLDTDSDGLVDGVGGIFPVATVSGGIDFNQDGFADGEQDYSTNPALEDTDGDGFRDGEEIINGSNPLDSLSFPIFSDGDLSVDGQVDVVDLLIALKILLGNEILTPVLLSHGDVAPHINGAPSPDGKFNLGDYIIIQRMILGL